LHTENLSQDIKRFLGWLHHIKLADVKKISSGWVKKYPAQSWFGSLFIAGWKYAQVRPRPIPNLDAQWWCCEEDLQLQRR